MGCISPSGKLPKPTVLAKTKGGQGLGLTHRTCTLKKNLFIDFEVVNGKTEAFYLHHKRVFAFGKGIIFLFALQICSKPINISNNFVRDQARHQSTVTLTLTEH